MLEQKSRKKKQKKKRGAAWNIFFNTWTQDEEDTGKCPASSSICPHFLPHFWEVSETCPHQNSSGGWTKMALAIL